MLILFRIFVRFFTRSIVSSLASNLFIKFVYSYWETLNCTLWHRFDTLMDLHNSSVRDIDVRKMQPQPDTHPHYVCFNLLSVWSEMLLDFRLISSFASVYTPPKLCSAMSGCKTYHFLRAQNLCLHTRSDWFNVRFYKSYFEKKTVPALFWRARKEDFH